MRVAIFTDNDFNKVSGVTTTLSAALQYAPPTMKLRVYTAADCGVDTPQYLALRSIGWPIPFYSEMRMYVPRVGEYLRRARADRIDVVHLTTPGPVGLAGMRVARRLNVPMVGSFHTDLAAYTAMLSGSPRLGGLMRAFMRWPYGRCARVLVPSEATRQLLIGARTDGRPMEIWTRGIDTEAFSPSRRSEQLRRAWHVCDRRPAVIYVGRVSREKGLDLLPALRDRLHRRGIEHQLVIAGDGPMRRELQSRLGDAVFTGVLNRRDVAEAFASGDVFVFPSRTDTAGNVVLEAQASGLPVVVSDAGGPKENMLPGSTGVVVSSSDPDDWADALVPLLQNAAERKRLGDAA